MSVEWTQVRLVMRRALKLRWRVLGIKEKEYARAERSGLLGSSQLRSQVAWVSHFVFFCSVLIWRETLLNKSVLLARIPSWFFTSLTGFLECMRQGETKDRKIKWMRMRTGAYSQAAFSNYVFYVDRNVLDGKARLLVCKTLSEMYVSHL